MVDRRGSEEVWSEFDYYLFGHEFNCGSNIVDGFPDPSCHVVINARVVGGRVYMWARPVEDGEVKCGKRKGQSSDPLIIYRSSLEAVQRLCDITPEGERMVIEPCDGHSPARRSLLSSASSYDERDLSTGYHDIASRVMSVFGPLNEGTPPIRKVATMGIDIERTMITDRQDSEQKINLITTVCSCCGEVRIFMTADMNLTSGALPFYGTYSCSRALREELSRASGLENTRGAYEALVGNDEEPEMIVSPDEFTMCLQFLEYVSDHSPTVVVAHNGFGFDYKRIYEAMARVESGVVGHLHPDSYWRGFADEDVSTPRKDIWLKSGHKSCIPMNISPKTNFTSSKEFGGVTFWSGGTIWDDSYVFFSENMMSTSNRRDLDSLVFERFNSNKAEVDDACFTLERIG